jgi:hypothetical protein
LAAQSFCAKIMSTQRVQYIRFTDLPLEWAAESGFPPQMVLRCLCEWTVVGAFPRGSLVTATGTEVAPLSVFEAFQALANEGAVHIGGYSWHIDASEALERLSAILVEREAVIRFCENTGTLPPRSLLGGIKRVWAANILQKHLAPPPCPGAEECAGRQSARQHAIGWMNTLRGKLAGLQGKPTWLGPRRSDNEPVDFDYWNAHWAKTWERAQEDVKRSGDLDLQKELDSLQAEWAAFVAQETAALAHQTTDRPAVICADISEPGKRRGRPSGSGSYKQVDEPIIELMREAVLREPNLSPTAAAIRFADRAAGGGTPESKAKRLVDRYSAKYGTSLR